MKRITQLLVVGLALLAPRAFGDVTSELIDFNVNDPITRSVGFTGFDTSLGTLNSVTITFLDTTEATGKATVSNNDATRQAKFTVSYTNTYTLTDTNSNSVELTLSNSDQKTIAALSSKNYTIKTSGVTESTVITGGDVAYYESAGTLSLVTTSDFTFSANKTISYTTSNSSKTAGHIEISYDYTPTPVPEPSQTVGMILAFGACLLVGRNYFRRQQTQA